MKIALAVVVLGLSFAATAAPTPDTIMNPTHLGKPLKSLGLGVAKESGYLTHSYTVGGCPIDVYVKNDANKTIVSLSMAAVPQCQSAKLGAVLKGNLPPLSKLTFGQLTNVLGPAHYTADCLTLCGNAANPSAYAVWPSLTAEVVLVDDPSIDASMRWEKRITDTYGEDYVIDNKFNCTKEFDAVAAREFHNVKVSRLTLRSSNQLPECQ